MPPSLLHSLSRTSPGSSTNSTPRAVSEALAPELLTAPTEEGDNHRGQYSSYTDHPSVRVTQIDFEENLSNDFNDWMISTSRTRSRSPGPSYVRDEGELQPQTSESSDQLSHSWWSEDHLVRPKTKTKVTEQTEALQSTRRKVAQAIASALGTAADITHEALFIGVDLLDLAPVPGLRPAAQLLLNIWDASQLVDMNVLSCLRLTERCADILISVRREIFDAGDVLEQELAAPIRKLEESFKGIHRLLIKLTNRPFLKRYLRRDEIMCDLSDCDCSLRDALGLFGISIQIRILKQVQEAEKHRQEESKALFEAIMTGRPPPFGPYSNISFDHFTTTENALSHFEGEPQCPLISAQDFPLSPILPELGLFEGVSQPPPIAAHDLPPSQILPELNSLHSIQNTLDMAMDTADLRQIMRAALQTTSDAEMLEVLEVSRQEMPDAIKTLQRALERVIEGDDEGVEAPSGERVALATTVNYNEVEGPTSPFQWPRAIFSNDSSNTSSSGHGSERRDTLDKEFIESGIECLRRLSHGIETSLPSWTITKYEVDRDKKIGIGFFSDVYKGTWQGRIVAIKVLAEATPKNLFVREIEIWKTLRHPNVLRLYGASSASGDPPWFFVSPYMKNGNLAQHLKWVELNERASYLGIGMGQMPLSPIRSSLTCLGSGTFPSLWTASQTRRDGTRGNSITPEDTVLLREWDLFRFMHEIAKGMEYLHGEGVLHGDLKGANVLVNDKYRCVISDFGQSEMKSEVYRISGTLPPQGTLRWQSPELMAGRSQLTQATDVWAFSMCCVEILTMGRIPWPNHDDDSVRYFVLKGDCRPPLPDNSRFNNKGLQDVLQVCWNIDPTQRPIFSKIVKDLKDLRKSSGQEVVYSPRIPVIDEESKTTTRPSPDMRPTMPEHLQTADNDLMNDIPPSLPRNSQPISIPPHSESTVSTEDIKRPELVIYTPAHSSHLSSFAIPTSSSSSSEEYPNVIDYDGYDSPPPLDKRIANTWNERRYRLLLMHDYHPTLTLPLWDPSLVEVGAVGYLSKPQGRFVTLFNALSTDEAAHLEIQSLPTIDRYGPTRVTWHRQDRKTITQRSVDPFAGLLNFPTFSEKVSRRYSCPLKHGHKMAYLCTETTDYRYLEKLDAPKKWFRTNVDLIMQIYGKEHQLQKEDLLLVIGTLCAPNYALFVSHRHPEGRVHFNVYATPKIGRPWGVFTTDTEVPQKLGPSYDDEANDTSLVQESKVSNHGRPWNTVLLARLRFKPDVLEPTSKK